MRPSALLAAILALPAAPFGPASDTRAWDTYVDGPGGSFEFAAPGGSVSTESETHGLNPIGNAIPLAWFKISNNDLGVSFAGVRLTLEISNPNLVRSLDGGLPVASLSGLTREAGGGVATFERTIDAAPRPATCDPDRVQPSGAIYRICMPAEGNWNGDLVLFTHGYADPNEPIAIPEGQLALPGGLSLPNWFTSLGVRRSSFAAS